MLILKPGDTLGEYVLDEPLGRGAFGEVWRAHHAVFNERVAVKVPTDPQYVRNLRTEGIIQHQIAHPHVVRTLTVNPGHDPPYMVMEYVDGRSLRDFLRDGRPLAVETALDYLRQILDALSAAHAAGVVHRDLKPENVLIDRANQVKVTDFGLGRVQEATSVSILASGSLVSAAGASLVGTVEYMAPEQKDPKATVDHRADLYAVGVMLFEMLTGERPTGTDGPSDLNPLVPKHLDAVYRRCHCRLVGRCRSAAEVREALTVHPSPSQGEGSSKVGSAALTPVLSPEGRGAPTAVAPSLVVTAAPVTRPEVSQTAPTSKPRRRGLTAACLVALGLLGLAIAVWAMVADADHSMKKNVADAKAVADQFYKSRQAGGDLDKALGFYMPQFFVVNNRDEWKGKLENVRTVLGDVKSWSYHPGFNVESKASTDSPLRGTWVKLTVDVTFTGGATNEELTLFKPSDGSAGYLIYGHTYEGKPTQAASPPTP